MYICDCGALLFACNQGEISALVEIDLIVRVSIILSEVGASIDWIKM